MPRRIEWTPAEDAMIIRMRSEGQSWDAIRALVHHDYWTLVERGRHIGARAPVITVTIEPEHEDQRRGCLPAGHPISWGAITRDTMLAGSAYVYRDPTVH
jgi:hypothetical protein